MKKIVLVVVIFLALGLFSTAFALEKPREAVVVDAKGVVEVKTPIEDWKPAQKGMVLTQGDIIRTQKASEAVLGMDDGGKMTTVELSQSGQLQLAVLLENKDAATQSTLLDLSMGTVLIKAQKIRSLKSKFEVKTPTSVVGIRGTVFSVSVESTE